MDAVKDAIRMFIIREHLKDESPANLHDDTRLISNGLLDSLAVLGLVRFVELNFGVELDVYETSAERIDSIEDIARLVIHKQGTLTERATPVP
jgi:acyl carrier protein